MKILILSIIVLFAWPQTGQAEYYKYRDKNGVLCFSDTLPEEYADQAETYQGSAVVTLPDNPPRIPSPKVSPTVQPPKPQAVPKWSETKFTLLVNRIVLPVEIVGTRGRAMVNLVMDTGAQRTFLWRSAIPSVGLRKVGRIRASGITGSKYASSVRVESLNLGPYSLRKVVVATMTPGRYHAGYDGLLGMDFLMKFKYEIDFKRKVVIWKGIH